MSLKDSSYDGDADGEGYLQELIAERPNHRADREEDPDHLGHRDINIVDCDSDPDFDDYWYNLQKTASIPSYGLPSQLLPTHLQSWLMYFFEYDAVT
ncbi:hypothetical protein V8E54_009407 [Elaphomyces granulatus]